MAAAVITSTCVACAGNVNVSDGGSNVDVETTSENLKIFKSDIDLTAEQKMSRIKSEYLIRNNGYKPDDKVDVIITLSDEAVIDAYLDSDFDGTVAQFAAGRRGQAIYSSISREQNALVNSLKSKKLIDGVNYNYGTLLNAVSAETTYGRVSELEKQPGILSVSLSDTFNRPQEAQSRAITENLVENVVDVYPTGIFNSSSVDYTGKKTAVAILDSGFDCSHSVFADELNDDELWITKDKVSEVLNNTNASSFTNGLKLTDVWYSNKIPFAYDYADKDFDVFPYDSEHGTHVAGIIGGHDDEITGVAVDTQLVLLKVFPDLDSGAETDDILAALEDAVELNVDAINMSLGSSCGFTREKDGDPINAVYDKINESGISLLTAASNSYSSAFGGEQGNTNLVTNPDSGTVGSPSTYEPSLSVASISGTKSRYLACNDSQIVFFTESNSVTGDPNDFFKELYAKLEKPESETLELGYVTVPGVGLRINYNTIKDKIKGKIALVRRGDSTFEDKALQAKNAGAIACIIYNNVDGDINMSMGKTAHIPTISISKDDGTALASRSEGTIVIKYGNQAGPFMSDFSSWGPSPDLTLKPEITAHGGNIRSSVPGGGYDDISGTSMATPNLCGIVVLIRQYLKEKYPSLKTKEISVLANEMLMSTANIVLNTDGNPYSPRKQGAGLASLYNVVNTRAYLTVDGKDRSKIELYDDPNRTGEYTMEFNLVNLSDADIDYDFSLVGMTESVSTSDATHVAERGQLLGGSCALSGTGDGSVAGNTVTVNGNGTLKLKAVYTLTDADKDKIDSLFPYGMYVEGFCKLAAKDEADIDLNIPFLAFYGDWTQAPMFDKTFYEVESEAHNGALDDDEKLKADYYATTPYGSYRYNYIIPLGSYLYDIDETKYDAIPASEEHIAISNQFATIDGISAIYGGLLRCAKQMRYTITDKVTGEVVWSETDYNANKAYSLGGSPIPYYHILNVKGASNEYTGTGIRDSKFLGLVNNREYEFKMQGALDYANGGLETNARNTFSFDFTSDNEAPVVKNAEYEKTYDRTLKKDRYYVTLTLYDNHYVQSVSPVIFTAENAIAYLTDNPIPVYSEKGKDSKIKIEITDYLDDIKHDALINNAICFYVDDYALNSELFVCQLPGTKGDFKFTSDGTPNGVEVQVQSIDVNEVFDLTTILSTTDKSVDEEKDYLKYLTWSSANEDIATVENGLVKGVRTGRTTVTATETVEGKRASIIINVREGSASAVAASGTSRVAGSKAVSGGSVSDSATSVIESLEFSYFDTIFAYSRAAQTSEIGETGDRFFISSLNGSVSFYPGESIKLAYDMQPWYVKDNYKDLTWSSTNDEVVKVEQDGTVTALKEGSASVSLRVAGSNLMATLRITVKNPFVIEDRTLIAYKGLGGHVEIPDDEGILNIGAYAFCLYDTDRDVEINEDDYDANKIPQANTAITSVTVPDGVEDIQKYAFYHCTLLRSVDIPASVRYVREYAFYEDEKLAEIDLSHVETIGAAAFYKCEALKTADLSKAFAIGNAAFYGSGIESVDLTTLRNTGVRAFGNTKSLKSVTLGANTKLSVEMFAMSGLTSVDIYERVAIPDGCFARCEALATVRIHNPLVSIGRLAFCQSDALEEIVFEAAAETIDEQAFYGCTNLKTVTLPDCAVSIGDNMFRDCANLTTVNFGENTRLLATGGGTFLGTKLQTFSVPDNNPYYSVSTGTEYLLRDKTGSKAVLCAIGYEFPENYTLPADITEIGEGAFSGSSIVNLTVTNKDLVIGEKAFAFCDKLVKVTLPTEKGVKIKDHAFNSASLEQIANLDKVAEIGQYAFANASSLESAAIGGGMTVPEGAFYRSGIVTLTLGDGATVKDAAIRDCTKLTTVNFLGTATVGDLAFYHCTSLKNIDMTKITGVLGENAFYACTSLSVAKLENVTEIGAYAFADCGSLATLTIPAVVKIGEGAFCRLDTAQSSYNAPIFSTVELPSTLREIGVGAFLGCSRLGRVVIPNGVTKIPDFAFAMNTQLVAVTLPDTVTEIGEYAFRGAESLVSINLKYVKKVGDSAFDGAYSFAGTVDLSSLEQAGDRAFYNTRFIGIISAPALKSVGKNAFYNNSFTAFSAPVLEYIGAEAFRDCRNLTSFTFSNKIAHVGSVAFQGCTRLAAFYNGTTGVTTGKINDYAFIEDGVLYTVYSDKDVQLASVPSAKNISVLTVKEGTKRVDTYAANANPYIRSVVFPDSLKVIGDYAFYGCSSLRDVEFRSIAAPVLENAYNYNGNLLAQYNNDYATASAHPLWVSWYSDMYELAEDAPGYELLHGIFDMSGYQAYYYTFKALAGSFAPIQMLVPSNDNITGYDSIIYEAFFGKVTADSHSTFVAREQALVDFVDYASAVAKLGTVTIADDALVSKAYVAYNAITQDPADFGYDKAEWDELVQKVLDARAALQEIKRTNASLAVRTLQREIDAMPTEYFEGAKQLLDTMDAKIKMLRSDDRALLDLTNYNKLLAAYNATLENNEQPGNPGSNGMTKGQLTVAIVVPVCSALVIAGAIAAVLLVLRKNKRSAAGGDAERSENAEEPKDDGKKEEDNENGDEAEKEGK